MSFNEIKCHVNTSLGLVGGCIPCIPPCVRAWSRGSNLSRTKYPFSIATDKHVSLKFLMTKAE